MSEGSENSFQPLGVKRAGFLLLANFSYVAPLLYALFLFNTTSQFFNELVFELTSESDSSTASFSTEPTAGDLDFSNYPIAGKVGLSVVYAYLGIASVSDFYTNLVAVNPIPEVIYERFKDEDSARTPYCSRPRLKYALMYFSFAVVGLALIDAEAEYIENEVVLIVLGSLTALLGYFYAHLLLAEKTKQHHRWFSENLKSSLTSMRTSFSDDFPSTTEFLMQTISNIFYKTITYAFITSSFLTYMGIQNVYLNLIPTFISGLAGGYQTLFTRFLPAKQYILDGGAVSEGMNLPLISGRNKEFSPKRFLFGTVRSVGLSYLTGLIFSRNSYVSYSGGGIMGLLLMWHTWAYSRKAEVSRSGGWKKEYGSNVNFLTNFMARSLRTVAIMVFLYSLSDFFSDNSISLDLSYFSIFMLSLAALGVEQNNFHFYKVGMNFGKKYWSDKFSLEKERSSDVQENFSLFSFLLRSKEEYNELGVAMPNARLINAS